MAGMSPFPTVMVRIMAQKMSRVPDTAVAMAMGLSMAVSSPPPVIAV